MLWIIFALLAALFTSLTTIFAKVGIKNVNSNFATAYRTLIVIVCAFIICLITNNLKTIPNLTFKNWLFLILSGAATGCSWLCYYKALKLGDVNKIVPIDKSSFILSSILFLIFFFDDTTKGGNSVTIIMLFVSIILIGIGTFMMITPKEQGETSSKLWLIFAVLSAIFAAIVSLFIKIGLKGISSDIGMLIRTIIVFVFAVAIVLVKKDYNNVSSINKKSWLFLTISGLSTGGAWLCEYQALNIIESNPVVINSIGKLSILITMCFSFIILKEKFSKKSIFGLSILILGIIIIIIFGI